MSAAAQPDAHAHEHQPAGGDHMQHVAHGGIPGESRPAPPAPPKPEVKPPPNPQSRQVAAMAMAGIAVVLLAVAMFIPFAREAPDTGGHTDYRVWSFDSVARNGDLESGAWYGILDRDVDGLGLFRAGGPILAAAALACLFGIFQVAAGKRTPAGIALVAAAVLTGAAVAVLAIAVHKDAPTSPQWQGGFYVGLVGALAQAGAAVAAFLMPATVEAKPPEPGIKKAEPRTFSPGVPEPALAASLGAMGAPEPAGPKTFTVMSGPTKPLPGEADLPEEEPSAAPTPPAPAAKAATKPGAPAKAASPAAAPQRGSPPSAPKPGANAAKPATPAGTPAKKPGAAAPAKPGPKTP